MEFLIHLNTVSKKEITSMTEKLSRFLKQLIQAL